MHWTVNAVNKIRTIRIPTDNSIETLCFCYIAFSCVPSETSLLAFAICCLLLLCAALRLDSPIWIMTLKRRINFMLVNLWILHKFEWFHITSSLCILLLIAQTVKLKPKSGNFVFFFFLPTEKIEIIWIHLHHVKSH